MDWSEIGKTALTTFYTVMLVAVSFYGVHRYIIVYLYYRHRSKAPKPAGQFAELPMVTIQLPMYNERAVAARIIEKTCLIDYPKDKLHIQVLDDSTDDTCRIAKEAADAAVAKGFDVEYIHRDNRGGYKAGALVNGLKTAKGEFVSIFDADFVPDPQFLKQSVQYFTDPKVCVVQSRWEHLNREDSILTRSQAIFLDGHFAIEHVARNRSERFMSFNGTAGTWRISAIEDAGGWHCDTLTEDLDLSYRAQLKGWKFIFLPNLTAPAELPPEMNAFKAQQFRWTKGGAQTALKLLPKVMLSKAPLKVKIESFFHLTCFCLHIFMLMLVLLMFPAMYFQTNLTGDAMIWRGLFDLGVFSLATMSASVFYIASQFELFGDWRTAFKYLPILMALGVGLCVSNTQAILEALFGKQSEFVRTPKYGDAVLVQTPAEAALNKKKKRNKMVLPCIEMALGLYMATCAVLSLMDVKRMLAVPFLLIFTFGFMYVSIMSFHAMRAPKPVTDVELEKVKA
ncbi:MAG: glycosyltransferase [Planctomycetaceae bacterium]|nr:MAG: glycosyltransferase [Planctomycetaceae bacterium]